MKSLKDYAYKNTIDPFVFLSQLWRNVCVLDSRNSARLELLLRWLSCFHIVSFMLCLSLSCPFVEIGFHMLITNYTEAKYILTRMWGEIGLMHVLTDPQLLTCDKRLDINGIMIQGKTIWICTFDFVAAQHFSYETP